MNEKNDWSLGGIDADLNDDLMTAVEANSNLLPPGLVILHRVCPDPVQRFRWIVNAVVAFQKNKKEWGLRDARSVVGFLADDFVLADGERDHLIRLIVDAALAASTRR